MKSYSLLSGAIASITVISSIAAANPASAYSLVSSYEVTDNTRYNFAAVINGLNNFDNADGAVTTRAFSWDGPGTFNIYEQDDGSITANLSGRMVNWHKDDQYWDVDIDFSAVETPSSLKGTHLAVGDTSEEKYAWAEENWSFFDFTAGSATLSADGGRYAGSSVQLVQLDNTKAVQFGDNGANDHTKDLGLSTWFKADTANSTFIVNGNEQSLPNNFFRGDFNVNLKEVPVPESVPEPTGLLGLGSVAALGLIGKKRKQS
ncbi:MAG: PEP-CTERM sorting domain-containing protein [Cyanobacteria bacterium P01_D01_bin.73]